MMTNIVDQTNDPGFAGMRVLFSAYPELQEFTKTAEMSPQVLDSLPNNAFAWPEHRKYPIHTPEHTALSVAYTKNASVKVPKFVVSNLVKAATIHGVPTKLYTQTKVAEATAEEYLLPDKKRFRVKTAEDVQLAQRVLLERGAQFSVPDRLTMAMNLTKMAGGYGVKLDSRVQRLSGQTMTSTASFRDSMRARQAAAEKVGSSAGVKAYSTLEKAYAGPDRVVDCRRDQVKLAACVYELDKQAGLVPMHGKSISDPVSAVFNTEHVRDDFVKVGSVLQDKQLVQSLPLEFWKDALGDDIAQEIAPGGVLDPQLLEQILPTLPNEMKSAVETQLAAYSK